MGNRVQEKPSFLFSVLSHGEIVHSSAVEAPWLCIVTIYVCAENKEAAEFFSQLSTLYNKKSSAFPGQGAQSLANTKRSCLQIGNKDFTMVFHPHALETQKI